MGVTKPVAMEKNWMEYPLAMLDHAGNHINEVSAQFILSLAPKVKVKWTDLEDLFSDDAMGRSYYYTRQLQLNESMALSMASGQYKLYTDVHRPAYLRFVPCPLVQNPESDKLLYRHDVATYDPPGGRKVKVIPKPAFVPDKQSLQAEVISRGYFVDSAEQKWYVPDMSLAKEVLARAVSSDLLALKLILDEQLDPIIITPTEILYLG